MNTILIAICWSAIGIAITYPVARNDDTVEKYVLLFLGALFGPTLLLILLRVLVETAPGWRATRK